MSPTSESHYPPVQAVAFSPTFLTYIQATSKYNKVFPEVVVKSVDIMVLNIAMVAKALGLCMDMLQMFHFYWLYIKKN